MNRFLAVSLAGIVAIAILTAAAFSRRNQASAPPPEAAKIRVTIPGSIDSIERDGDGLTARIVLVVSLPEIEVTDSDDSLIRATSQNAQGSPCVLSISELPHSGGVVTIGRIAGSVIVGGVDIGDSFNSTRWELLRNRQ